MAAIKMFIKEKLINILLNCLIVIFGIILMISIYTGVQIKLLGHDYANFFGYSTFEVQTNSMGDVVSAGDWIIVKITSNIKLDDIVTYQLKDDFITHRVIAIHNGTYITKGDANNAKDEPVDQSQIVGKNVKTLKNFGIFRKVLFNPGVLLTLIITLFLFDSVMKKNQSNKLGGIIIKLKSLVATVILNSSKLKPKTKEIISDGEPISNETPIPNFIAREENKENVLVVQDELPKHEEAVTSKIEASLPEEKEPNQIKEEIIVEEPELEKIIVEPIISAAEIKDIQVPNDSISSDEDDEIFEDYDYVADELEKTQFFRMIHVDANEIDETLLEIAKNEMTEKAKEENTVKKEIIKEEIIEEPEGLTNIDLELVKNSTRRNKNLIDAVMNIKRDELNELIEIISGDDKLQINEATIKTIFINTYINARYYNYYGEKNVEYRGKNLVTKIEKVMQLVANEVCNKYSGSDKKYSEKIDKFVDIFDVIASLEQAQENITELPAKREFYRSELSKYKDRSESELTSLANEIMKIQKSYDDVIEYFFKKMETNDFYLDETKITSKKNMYAVNISHNISFNKIYSDYIIDKTYSEGVIAEDKIIVLVNLLMTQLARDMIKTDFAKKYIITVPASLYNKEKKIWRILKLFEDEYAKSHIIILIDFKDLILNKSNIKKIRKSGYRFALAFSEASDLLAKDRGNLYMANIIFVDKTEEKKENLEAYIPDDLLDNIVYDNILGKISPIEGE